MGKIEIAILIFIIGIVGGLLGSIGEEVSFINFLKTAVFFASVAAITIGLALFMNKVLPINLD